MHVPLKTSCVPLQKRRLMMVSSQVYPSVTLDYNASRTCALCLAAAGAMFPSAPLP